MRSRRAAPLLVASVIASRLAEIRIARRNEQIARSRGAVEHGAAHYPLFFVLHPAWLVGMLAETRTCDEPVRPAWLVLAAAAQPLRWWTMRALGTQWTTRILIQPDARRVTYGLYRRFDHPAYAAVTAELLALPLALRAPRTAATASLVNAVLLGLIRIPAERRAEATRRAAPPAR